MNKLGFGFLRLPLEDTSDNQSIDWKLMNQLVDLYISKGGTYFDTAYTYLDGMSEYALKKAVVERYDRDKIWIADKLPSWKVASHEDCYRYFEEQRNRCGVTYFDTYLLHWLNKDNYEIAEKYDEFGFLQELKANGRAKKIGFSYHDSAMLLERILTEHPEVDVVQLQINYLDWESPAVEARKCYEVAKKHNKPVIVMEPVKGGTLAKLPKQTEACFEKYNAKESPASYAIRFVQSLENVEVVLSGMNAVTQMNDNMRDMPALDQKERDMLDKVCEIIREKTAVPCTGCRYCVAGCPKGIVIPQIFSIYNEYYRYPEEDWKITPKYTELTLESGKASECITCKKCENSCPQHIEITSWLKTAAAAFE
ncbi:MAG: 4Fe-4S dicluster domain-containing protein [Clostridia bacterium]|nr:4Fe-4S dicluster domain-containing protein [Clostridia bacterium]